MQNVDADIAFAIRGCMTKRFHAVDVQQNETVGHHVGLIASLAAILFPHMRPEFWCYVALHDAAERVTGDAPSTAKRLEPQLKVLLDRVEDMSYADAKIRMPLLTDYEQAVFKLLDNTAGIVTCWYELMKGNRLIRQTLKNFVIYYGQTATRPGWFTLLWPEPGVRRLTGLVQHLASDADLSLCVEIGLGVNNWSVQDHEDGLTDRN